MTRIPLLPMAKLILEKYKGKDRLIPIQDPSDINKYLKDIAILCHIDKYITFHTSPHQNLLLIEYQRIKNNGEYNC